MPLLNTPAALDDPAMGQSAGARASGLFIAGHPLESANIVIPAGLPQQEHRHTQNMLAAELQFQENNPPCLPRSQIRDLSPKPHMEDWQEIPENCDEETKTQIQDYNNVIATELQRIDRERNNKAAKKSRETRVEALNNAKAMLNDKAAELTWLRLKLVVHGGNPNEWEAVSSTIKDAMVTEIKQRVEFNTEEEQEFKKKKESQRRIDRNRQRAAHRSRRTSSQSSFPNLENLSELVQSPLMPSQVAAEGVSATAEDLALEDHQYLDAETQYTQNQHVNFAAVDPALTLTSPEDYSQMGLLCDLALPQYPEEDLGNVNLY